MRNVGTVNFSSAKPLPAPAGSGRAGGKAKNPSKIPCGSLSNEGQ
jgi:hypothetical protein